MRTKKQKAKENRDFVSDAACQIDFFTPKISH